MWTQIRPLLQVQSDQGPHCLPVCKNRFEKFVRIFSRWYKQMIFSDAGFLGILRVKIAGWVASSVDSNQMLWHLVWVHCLLRPVWPNTFGKYMYGFGLFTYFASFDLLLYFCFKFVELIFDSLCVSIFVNFSALSKTNSLILYYQAPTWEKMTLEVKIREEKVKE